MGDGDEPGRLVGHGNSLEDHDRAETSWTASKLLLDAHTRSGKALERYMLVQHLEKEEGTDDELRETIEQAITDHERIIETLETALSEIDHDAEQ